MTKARSNSNSVTSGRSCVPGVDASAGAIPAPVSVSADANNSDPVRESQFPPSASATSGALVASLFSFDNAELEEAVRALEIEWLRAGIIMNAMTLRVIAASDSVSKSVSLGA